MAFAVVLDTCTLYPAHLRDTLLRLAELGLYRPMWSSDILRELSTNLENTARIDGQAVDRLLSEMSSSFPEAYIGGYEGLIDSMFCDPKDRHVLAVAVRGGAGAVVTFNLRAGAVDTGAGNAGVGRPRSCHQRSEWGGEGNACPPLTGRCDFHRLGKMRLSPAGKDATLVAAEKQRRVGAVDYRVALFRA